MEAVVPPKPPPVKVPLYQDPFRPVLLNSKIVELSHEQRYYLRKILESCSSDSASANKAFDAIEYILTLFSIVPVSSKEPEKK